MPTGPQRVAIERRLAELQAADVPGPETHLRKTITVLLTSFAQGGATEASTEIKAMVYLEALSDLPAWTVAEARRRWARGECAGGPHNYSFAPSPAALRAAALDVLAIARGEVVGLRRCLSAVTAPEPLTDEERAVMLERFGGLIADLTADRLDRIDAVDTSPTDLMIQVARARRERMETAPVEGSVDA